MTARKILFVLHDGSYTGANIVLLQFIKWIKKNTDFQTEILLKKNGPARKDFEKLSGVRIWDTSSGSNNKNLDRNYKIRKILRKIGLESFAMYLHAKLPALNFHKNHQEKLLEYYQQARINLVYSNTITNGNVLNFLAFLNCPVISHIHELDWINKFCTEFGNLRKIKKYTSQYIAVSKAVELNMVEKYKIPADRIEQVYEFIDPESGDCLEKNDSLLNELMIPEGSIIIGASGSIEWRKGPDLFIQLAKKVTEIYTGKQLFFIWVGGDCSGDYFHDLETKIHKYDLNGKVLFTGQKEKPLEYFSLFDIFAMVSREDPFPLVNLENALLGNPIICFKNSGGSSELVENCCGYAVDYLDLDLFARRIVELIESKTTRKKFGAAGMKAVKEEYNVEILAPELVSIIEKNLLH
jgi:glycosyltransferase involved in cell wall biosynthesis